ncbi:MAG: hypothetical protein ACYTG0_07870 [Planctomycetota bacterium]
MNVIRLVVPVLACWCAWASATLAADKPSDDLKSLRKDLSELKVLATRLLNRVEALERRVSQLERTWRRSTVGQLPADLSYVDNESLEAVLRKYTWLIEESVGGPQVIRLHPGPQVIRIYRKPEGQLIPLHIEQGMKADALERRGRSPSRRSSIR